MAVDEFGREIPAPRGGQRSPSPPHRHRHHLHDGFNGGGVDMPSHLNDSLPTSRYEDRGNDRDYDRSSSRKRKQRSRSPPPHRSRSPPPPMMSSRRGGGRERSFRIPCVLGKGRRSLSGGCDTIPALVLEAKKETKKKRWIITIKDKDENFHIQFYSLFLVLCSN